MSYEVKFSEEFEDQAWDEFLASTPGGHHVQTSMWARVKRIVGWRVVRLVVTQGDDIVAGAQVLLRRLSVAGSIGYLPKGPIFAHNDPELVNLVLVSLDKLVRKYGVRFLAAQPPNNGDSVAAELPRWRYQPIGLEMLPTVTTWLDLTPTTDQILGQMKSKLRYNIRLSQRRGVTTREGTEADLDEYYRLMKATSERQHFAPFPKAYFAEMWRMFAPKGYLKLFVTEIGNQVVSAQIAIPFGDIVINKLSVWSGEHRADRPNEALYWATMQWAKANGFHYYDFEGIDLNTALQAANEGNTGDGNPAEGNTVEAAPNSVTSFKLGFGGEVKLLPGVFGYIPHPMMRWMYRKVAPQLEHFTMTGGLLHYLRTFKATQQAAFE